MFITRKGQGLTEYGIILLLILLVGMGVWFNFDLRGNIGSLYSTIFSDLSSIAGRTSKTGSEYDMGQAFIVALNDIDSNHVRTVTLQSTSLTSNIWGAGWGVYWYTEDNGTKTYISSPYKANVSTDQNGVIANQFKLNNYDSSGSDTYYFRMLKANIILYLAVERM